MRPLFALSLGLLASAYAAPTLHVQQGTLQGTDEVRVQRFLGVPFAAPPVGPLRWRAPQPPLPWKGVRQATRFGPMCAQGRTGQEDCLYLNIYRPVPGPQPTPVMIWIHGGFFTGGDAREFDGSVLARLLGVSVITVNYRVGIMGFLAAPGVGDGNYGLYDVVQSVRWVRQNARALNIDPNNVTLFGNSAGGSAICTLMTAPAARGLFQKAILQSGSCASPVMVTPLTDARKVGQRFVDQFDCGLTPAFWCMRQKSLAQLQAARQPSRQPIDPVPLPPVYGDLLIPQKPQFAFQNGEFMKIPVLLGSNANEGRALAVHLSALGLPLSGGGYEGVLRLLDWNNADAIWQHYPPTPDTAPAEAMAQVLTDRVFACPTDWLAAQLARHVPTYHYEFNDPHAATTLKTSASIPDLGAFHGSEIAYIFRMPVASVVKRLDLQGQQRLLSSEIGGYWTQFARTGNPNGWPLTRWEARTPTQPRVQQLRPSAEALPPQLNFYDAHRCRLWNGLDGLP